MKRLNRSFSRHLLVLVLLLNVTALLHAQTCLPDKVDFAKEYQLDVLRPPYLIDRHAIAENEDRFRNYVHCPGNSPCTPNAVEINARDVVSILYNEANNFIVNPMSPCLNSKECISGVWIIMGMEDNVIKYYFQPAVLKANLVNNEGNPVFDSVFVGDVYTVAGGLTKIAKSNQNAGTKAYHDGILIKHFRNRGKHEHGRFRNPDGSMDNTWRGDSRKIFYSFQEILGFYSLQNPNESTNRFYCHKIFVNHSAGLFTRLPKNLWNSWRIKHNTFITVGNDSTENFRVEALSESTNGTDLAHVCPSKCNSLTYLSASRAQGLTMTKKKR